MNKLIILLSLIFAVSCSNEIEKEKDDSDLFGPPVSEERLEPHEMTYPVINAIYYINTEIADNFPEVKGSQENLQFLISPPLPAGMSFNTETGRISGTPTTLQERAFYTVTAKNDYGLASLNISVRVQIPPPRNLSYSTLADNLFFRNLNAGSFSPSVVGTVESYSIDPFIPSGMTFDSSTGILSGVPNALVGRRPFKIKAQNQSGFSEYSFFLRIIDIPPSNLSYQIQDSTYNVNQAIATNVPTSEGGAIDLFVINPVELPPGLFFNSSNGWIQGTPLFEVPNPQSYVVTALNTGGSVSTSISIRVLDKAPPIPVYSQNNINYTKDTQIVQNIVLCAGENYNPINCPDGRPTNFSISPSLPEGLTISQNNGFISGTPTELRPMQAYTVTASNSGGVKNGTISFAVLDKPPLNIRYPQTLYTIRKDEFFRANISNNEGGDVVSYSIAPALPTGLNFNTSTGEISGTPTITLNQTTYTVSANNTGGSAATLVQLRILPVPNYQFTYALKSKDEVSFGTIQYVFELTNTSREFDNSTGINLSLPIVVSSGNTFITPVNDPLKSTCRGLVSFGYLQKCLIVFNYQTEFNPSSVLVNVDASTVKTQTIDLLNFIDISPQNVVLTSERTEIVKAIFDDTAYSFVNDPATNITNSGVAQQTIDQFNGTKNNTQISLTSESLLQDSSILGPILDPDSNGQPGMNIFENILFTNRLLVTANMNGYQSVCNVEPPFAQSTSCILGAFDLPSNNLNYTGSFTVSIGTNEGTPEEKTVSNPIAVNVYKVKRVSHYSDAADPLKNVVLHKNKIYFPGLTDRNNTSSRKMMSYDPFSSELRLMTRINSSLATDDRAYPFASYEDLLFFKGFSSATVGLGLILYSYDDVQDSFSPIYLQNCTNSNNQPYSSYLISSALDQSLLSFNFNGKIYFSAKKSHPCTDDPLNIETLYSYDKNSNKIKREIEPFNPISAAANFGIKSDSPFIYDNKIYFNSYILTGSLRQYKQQYLDHVYNNLRYVINRNGSTSEDYLYNPFLYDNKLFYISSGSGSNVTTIPSDLVYVEAESPLNPNGVFRRLMTSSGNGQGKIFGTYYGKLFFMMPIAPTRQGLFYYDALEQKIVQVYETPANGKLFSISKFSNFENELGFYFVEQNGAQRSLMYFRQNTPLFEITKVVDSSVLAIGGATDPSDITMFNYNNTLFFSCSSSNEGLCIYNHSKKTAARIIDNIRLNSEPDIMGRRPRGIVFINNKIYFSTRDTTRNRLGGLFELCILGENGCQ